MPSYLYTYQFFFFFKQVPVLTHFTASILLHYQEKAKRKLSDC